MTIASLHDRTHRELVSRVDRFAGTNRSGPVVEITGTIVRARIPEVRLGELCLIERGCGDAMPAEVVGFDQHGALLVPLGRLANVRQNSTVRPTGLDVHVPVGDLVRGRVIDALGEPIDGRGPLGAAQRAPMVAEPPNPLTRRPFGRVFDTGVRAIDTMLTLGEGQRVGIFAAAGAGKSTLMAMICRNVDADVCVLALIGERGWEVSQFVERDLGAAAMAKSTVVVSTSDQPALLRLKAAYTATAIAEQARREGKRVVLLMDSVTRFARALREVGIAAGEPVGRQGYPASVFATLPQLFERAGNDASGSITAFYTVLVAGDDLEEPIADESISLLDGHIILSRKLAERGHYPAIDVRQSVSRWMSKLVNEGHRETARRAKDTIAQYEENYDKFTCGVYEEGSDPRLDSARQQYPALMDFLKQPEHEYGERESDIARLAALIGGG